MKELVIEDALLAMVARSEATSSWPEASLGAFFFFFFFSFLYEWMFRLGVGLFLDP